MDTIRASQYFYFTGADSIILDLTIQEWFFNKLKTGIGSKIMLLQVTNNVGLLFT